ncbi:Pao retrotransposon peptidase family protein [Aphelenchoides avenae]|nr:Pao retrotransposon peptidase family protein [Aphelenchus avenae]
MDKAEKQVADDYVAFADANHVDDIIAAVRARILKLKTSLKECHRNLTKLADDGKDFGSGERKASSDAPSPKPEPLHLQQIPLKPFDGNIMEYPNFIRRFEDIVNEKGRMLADRQKLQYLLQNISGEPAQLAANFPIEDGSYNEVRSLLADYYDKPTVVTNKLYSHLAQLRPPQPDYSDLRRFLIEIDGICRQLKSMKADPNQATILLNIENKLPPDVVEHIYARLEGTTDVNTESFLQAFRKTLSLKEKSATREAMNRASRPPRPQHFKAIEPSGSPGPSIQCIETTPGTGAFAAAINTGIKCALCGFTNHKAADCPKYPTVEERVVRLSKLRKCVICLLPHKPTDCPHAARPCSFCKEAGHNRALCEKRAATKSNHLVTDKPRDSRPAPKHVRYQAATNASYAAQAGSPDDFEEELSHLGLDSDSDNDRVEATQSAIHVNALNGNRRTHLLECVQATLLNSDNGKWETVTVFFHSGSSVSYVHKELAARLGLPQLRFYKMPVTLFGGKRRIMDVFDTEMDVQCADGRKLHLQLRASDELSGGMHVAPVDPEDIPHLRNNNCAIVPSEEEPLVLKGRDLQHMFRKMDEETPLPNGFTITHSVLGQMLTGRGNVRQPFATAARPTGCPPVFHTHAASVPTKPSTIGSSEPKTDAPQGEMPTSDCFQDSSSELSVDSSDEDTLTPDTISDSSSEHSEAAICTPNQDSEDDRTAQYVFFVRTDSDLVYEQQPAKAAENMWTIENIGITLPPAGDEDDLVHQRFIQTLHKDADGRYETPLPWRTPDGTPVGNDTLSQNFGQAAGRLPTLCSKHPDAVLQKIENTFQDYKDKQIVSDVPYGDFHLEGHTSYYLPLQIVIKESSNTTKLRTVFDGSAKPGKGQPAINDYVHRGPVLTPDMPGLLLRSRLHPIILPADIEKAYLQVGISPHDHDACRFLWLKDFRKPVTRDNLRILRLNRVTFGLKPSAFLLAATINVHLDNIGTPLAHEIKRNCYVDNILMAADNAEEALEKYRESKQIFAEAKMNLREYVSNSQAVNEALPEADRGDTLKLANLGIKFRVDTDQWIIPLRPKGIPISPFPVDGQLDRILLKDDQGPLTKRKAVAQLQSVYDPQGLGLPAILPAKLLVQEFWKQNLKWDKPAPADLVTAWHEATEKWAQTDIVVPRRVSSNQIVDPQIHVFVDASAKEYGIASYLKCGSDVSLIFSRVKLSPLKDEERRTIVDLELMAMALGARNARYLAKELGMPAASIHLWTDSMINLYRVQDTEKKQTVFIENRLKEIRMIQRELGIAIGHVRTDENPADIVSRGIDASELQSCTIWWKGPSWLKDDASKWPAQPNLYEQEAAEVTCSNRPTTPPNPLDAAAETARIGTFASPSRAWIDALARDTSVSPDPLVDLGGRLPRLKSWDALVGVSAHVLKGAQAFLRLLKSGRHSANLPLSECFPVRGSVWQQGTRRTIVTATELADATYLIIRKTQLRHMPTGREIHEMGIGSHDGILFCTGRVDKSSLPSGAKLPIYIPRQSEEAKLLAYNAHICATHAGAKTILANLRKQYWFTQGRLVVKAAIRKYCRRCDRFNAQPYKLPNWPNLPEARVNMAPPFKHSGVDYARPFWLTLTDAEGRTFKRKHWICIFTCLAVRAIHLELIDNLSTNSFMQALRRFMNRRGIVQTMISDNGTQFVASKEIYKMVTTSTEPTPPHKRGRKRHQSPSGEDLALRQELREWFRPQGLRWTCITERAPWRGAVYERLIGILKNNLRRTICSGRQLLSAEKFSTLLTDIENTVNCRPLTYVSDSEPDFRIIRPIDFLQPMNEGPPVNAYSLPSEEAVRRNATHLGILEMLKEAYSRIQRFWELWKDDYLLALRERGTHARRRSHAKSTGRIPQVDEIVLVEDANLPRACWRLGRIVHLDNGADGIVRTAMVKFGTGNVKPRAINQLYPLEVHPTIDTEDRIWPAGGPVGIEKPRETHDMSSDTLDASEQQQERPYGPASGHTAEELLGNANCTDASADLGSYDPPFSSTRDNDPATPVEDGPIARRLRKRPRRAD